MTQKQVMMKDIEDTIDECQKPDYYGNLTIKFNIQGGHIRNVNYMPERCKKYE